MQPPWLCPDCPLPFCPFRSRAHTYISFCIQTPLLIPLSLSLSLYVCISISLSLSIYIYIHTVCVYMYIYIYTIYMCVCVYIYRERERERERDGCAHANPSFFACRLIQTPSTPCDIRHTTLDLRSRSLSLYIHISIYYYICIHFYMLLLGCFAGVVFRASTYPDGEHHAVHPVSITRFSITIFSPGSGLLRILFLYR